MDDVIRLRLDGSAEDDLRCLEELCGLKPAQPFSDVVLDGEYDHPLEYDD